MSNDVKQAPQGMEPASAVLAAEPAPPEDDHAVTHARGRHRSLSELLSIRNIGAIYTWIVIIALFSLLAPDTFPSTDTAKSILNQYAITGLVALALVIPLACGVYDLSVGYMVGFSGVFVANLLDTSTMSPVLAGLITLAVCFGLGCVNAFVVVVLRVNSFIGTLGTGALFSALTIAVSDSEVITGRVGEGFSKIASTNIGGFTLPVFYMLIAMIGIGYWLERTGSGRRIYAVGFDREASRLSGLRVNRSVFISLAFSASLAGFAGMVLAGRVASGSPEAGPSYLIPAFSAAFLGATQLRGGRFNPWGTVIGVLLIGTGDLGLVLTGGPTWTTLLFEGLVLIVAVALSVADKQAIVSRVRELTQRARIGRVRTQ